MFGVKPFLYTNDNKNYHRKTRKYYKRYNNYRNPKQPQPPRQVKQPYDLRLIVVRHGERLDLTLGPQWYTSIFGNNGVISPQSYQDPRLPKVLPQRVNPRLYEYDPPITRNGERLAIRRGYDLYKLGTTIDYCYSSPACRSVLTANGILDGMGLKKHVPICIEPYLFEPMVFNRHFLDARDLSLFMSREEWANAGYNINRRYPRIHNSIDIHESEHDFLHRSDACLKTIERFHGRGGRPTTVLIAGHTGTPLIFSTLALKQQFDPYQFGMACGQIPYLHTRILERDAKTHTWSDQSVPFEEYF